MTTVNFVNSDNGENGDNSDKRTTVTTVTTVATVTIVTTATKRKRKNVLFKVTWWLFLGTILETKRKLGRINFGKDF